MMERLKAAHAKSNLSSRPSRSMSDDLDLPQAERDSRSLLVVSNGTEVSRNIKCFSSSSPSWMSIQSTLNLNWYGGGCHFLTVLGSVSMAVGGKGPPPNTSQVTPSLKEVQGTQGRSWCRAQTALLYWLVPYGMLSLPSYSTEGAQDSKSLRPIWSTWDPVLQGGVYDGRGHMYIQPQRLEANTRHLLSLIHLGWVENELQKLSWLHLRWAS